MVIQFDEDKQKRQFDELRKNEEEGLAQMMSGKYGIGYLDLSTVAINPDALRLAEEAKAREGKLAVFNMVGKKLEVAVLSPEAETTVAVLKGLAERGYETVLHMVSTRSMEKAWSRYKDISYAYETKAGALDLSNEQITAFLKEVQSIESVRKLIQDVLVLKKSYRISRIVEIILAGAIATKASDIHIEPEENDVGLRYRLDGVLVEILRFDVETYSLLLSRIKLLSGLKLNVKGNAQDGRFSVSIDNTDIEIRASILPGAYNESIVLRVLNPNSISVPLEALGIEPKLLKILLREISKPNGMVLTTGPTGSGKTTTLYAFLRKVHSSEIKIITIEDPIEYHLPGIVQTQTNPEKGYTFLQGLRSALRQDPDVIMVGEIRDQETAEIAVNSALTGHLVFSTLHTNDAAGAYPRLIDLGVNPKVITSAVTVAIAQRLIRKLCETCKKKVPLEDTKKVIIEKVLATIKNREDVPREAGFIFEPVGCLACNNTGYKGRIGIYEAILSDENIEKIVQENPSEREIVAAAEPQGILNMQQDGVLKVLSGVTSLDELERVIELK